MKRRNTVVAWAQAERRRDVCAWGMLAAVLVLVVAVVLTTLEVIRHLAHA